MIYLILMTLHEKYQPSPSCSCEICVSFCKRPGWWTPQEAEKAIDAGFAGKMMLEISPELNFGVLSPAFKGNENHYSLQEFAENGCTFLKNDLCELHGTGLQPLECRYCDHTSKGKGLLCHKDIEQEWKSPDAKRLIVKWGNLTGFWEKQGVIMVERPK